MKTEIDISVIIVNYNVEYFLEQCLNSVFKSLNGLNGEVFVVDNDSIDGSVEMVKEKFPQVKLIANKHNVGFSKANNQALEKAEGRYCLLLNPDTVVEEDTFSKCVNFMDSKPDAGGLGVRMIDGKGNFLPESKRGLPTPAVAFYKIFGISKLFPKSKKFGAYHLGYLDEHEINEIEVLSGAFMLMRKSALIKTGFLDEAFFMYGEDIDLSYRITKAGYKNYYFPKTQIIHYKGESTKKSSINYVFVFYRAMVIFAEKHFSQKNAKLFSFLINLAIYFRASLALLNRFIKKSILPTFDFTAILIILISLTQLWSKENINFPSGVLYYALPTYTFIWQFCSFYFGGYDKPIKLVSYIKGGLIGTLIILAGYALLPKDFQFSRLFILLGALSTITYFILSRLFLSFTLGGKFSLTNTKEKSFGIVGDEMEVERVKKILKASNNNKVKLSAIHPSNSSSNNYLGRLEQLDQIIHIHKIDEVVFCAKNVTAEDIIKWMSKASTKNIEFKIAQPESMYLIGSNSVDSAGDLYILGIDKINQPRKQRDKRAFDFILSISLLLLLPFSLWFFKNKWSYIKNLFLILIGRKSFVGYFSEKDNKKLPRIKNGVLAPVLEQKSKITNDHKYKMNLIYARDYDITMDWKIVLKNWQKLDNS